MGGLVLSTEEILLCGLVFIVLLSMGAQKGGTWGSQWKKRRGAGNEKTGEREAGGGRTGRGGEGMKGRGGGERKGKKKE